jgi:hypothetical protein
MMRWVARFGEEDEEDDETVRVDRVLLFYFIFVVGFYYLI